MLVNLQTSLNLCILYRLVCILRFTLDYQSNLVLHILFAYFLHIVNKVRVTIVLNLVLQMAVSLRLHTHLTL